MGDKATVLWRAVCSKGCRLLLTLAVATSCTLLRPPPIATEVQVQETIRGILATTVYLGTKDRGPGGAAVVIQHTKGKRLLLITAEHIVEGVQKANKTLGCSTPLTCSRVYMMQLRDPPVPLTALIRDKGTDLAVLRSEGKMTSQGPVATFPTRPILQGHPIWVVGAPGGARAYIARGVVSKLMYLRRAAESSPVMSIFTDAGGWFGNSGGGLYSDDGKLLGIVQAITPFHATIAIHHRYVQELLSRVK